MRKTCGRWIYECLSIPGFAPRLDKLKRIGMWRTTSGKILNVDPVGKQQKPDEAHGSECEGYLQILIESERHE